MKPSQRYELHRLAELLVTPERFGKVAVENTLAPDERILTLVEPLQEALPFYAVPWEPEGPEDIVA